MKLVIAKTCECQGQIAFDNGLHKSDLRFDFEKAIVINNGYFIFET